MELLKLDGVYIAKTKFGEWEAKRAGFTWDKAAKAWKTTDPAKALELSAVTGLCYNLPHAPPPHHAEASEAWPTVKAGRYALANPTTGSLDFYQVERPATGKWAGWIFLKKMASDVLHRVYDKQVIKAVLDELAKNPLKQMALYGQTIGKCGHCSLTLTDPESRELGLGPICRKKLGYQE